MDTYRCQTCGFVGPREAFVYEEYGSEKLRCQSSTCARLNYYAARNIHTGEYIVLTNDPNPNKDRYLLTEDPDGLRKRQSHPVPVDCPHTILCEVTYEQQLAIDWWDHNASRLPLHHLICKVAEAVDPPQLEDFLTCLAMAYRAIVKEGINETTEDLNTPPTLAEFWHLD